MRARNDTDMRDAQGLRVRGFKIETGENKGTKKDGEPLDEIMQEVRAVEELRGTCRECGECVNFPILALRNYRGRNRKNLNHDANGKAAFAAAAAALHILKRDPDGDRRLFIRRYRPTPSLPRRRRGIGGGHGGGGRRPVNWML